MKRKKSRINKNTYLVDRISPLPDSLLGYILSFLATKEAVTTSVLSKRWKFAWVTVHNLDFYYNDSNRARNEAENMKFVLFVYRVLLLRDAGWLNKFSLVWHTRSIPSHVSTWIDTAITKKVHELYLAFNERMPIRVFNCDSLRSLKLLGSTFLDDKTVIYLPKLESMKLDSVYFKSKEACEKLVSGCPMLHYLNLNICSRDDYDDYYDDDDVDDDDDDDFTCIISSASLRHLEIYFEGTSCLHLKASSLEYLKVNGAISKIYVEKRLGSLVEADIHIDLDRHDFPNNSIVKVVRAFDCAKFLTLSSNVMQALRRATISLSTEFKRLVKLEAHTYFSSSQDFIQNSDNLEDLIIHQYSSSFGYHSKCTTPVEVPRCLSNSLKKVQLYGYTGSEDEREMIRYILQYGSALEVMTVSCYSKEQQEKLKLVQDICEFPRKSPVCKVKFLV